MCGGTWPPNRGEPPTRTDNTISLDGADNLIDAPPAVRAIRSVDVIGSPRIDLGGREEPRRATQIQGPLGRHRLRVIPGRKGFPLSVRSDRDIRNRQRGQRKRRVYFCPVTRLCQITQGLLNDMSCYQVRENAKPAAEHRSP